MAAGTDASHARKGYRQVYFDGGFIKTPVYEGLNLENGNELVGPAIIEQPNTTLVIPNGYRMVCDPYSNYILSPLLPLDGSQN